VRKALSQKTKAIFYPLFPSSSPALHAKRRKGMYYRHAGPEVLECQKEQDKIYWRVFLSDQKKGNFLEVGGDGVVGSHTLGLELNRGWEGAFCSHEPKLRQRAESVRKCETLEKLKEFPQMKKPDLLAVHQPFMYPDAWDQVRTNQLNPRWIIVENRDPDPQWCRLLEGLGYKLKFFFHDDEYYKLKA